MANIIFYNSWGESTFDILNRYGFQTPNNDGKWEDIVGVNNQLEADFYVVMDGEPDECKQLDYNKKVFFQREPDYLKTPDYYLVQLSKFSFPYSRGYQISNWRIKLPFNELKKMKYPKKTKNASVILTAKTTSYGHAARLSFVNRFSQKCRGKIDVYGRGLDPAVLGSDYRGEIGKENGCKFLGLKDYSYSLAFENGQLKNYFTEKICDCFLSWTIPVYWGCYNISDFFPENSYYNLDIYRDDAFDVLKEILNIPVEEKHIKALEEARNLVLYKYNLWPSIKRVIDTGSLL